MPTRSPSQTPSRFPPELILNLGSCFAVLAIVTLISYLLVRERDGVEQSSIRASSNVVQLIESDILRNAQSYDQSLEAMIWASKRPELAELPTPLRQRLLFNQALIDAGRGDLLWLDAKGDVAGHSVGVLPQELNLAHTGVFKAHQGNAHLGLLVGPPFKARLGDPEWCISFSRRISAADGSFAGIAAGALRLSYFSDMFKRLDIGRDSSVNLLNTDGQLLVREPNRPGDPQIGTDFSGYTIFQRIRDAGSGTFAEHSQLYDERRIYTFSRVGELPLIVLVVNAADDVLRPWWRTALVVGIATGVLCIGILWLTLLLGRELRRRHLAERGLATLAATDSLTGLANRRRLDQVLRLEWARAQRNRKPMAVLMVDVDHFKAFNQRHGHAGGDHALREVALTIERCLRRPADLVARYGGEEFQVVLPETELAGAMLLAERIRAGVEALAPFGGDLEPITVSIGVGLYEPGTQHDLTRVLGAADEAAYRAKAKGRNRVEGP